MTGTQSQIRGYGQHDADYLTLSLLHPFKLQVKPTSLLQTLGYWTADSVLNLKFPVNQR